jgi:hypothetical protein
MNEIALANKTTNWQRLKTMVLDSVSSPITKRVYNLGLDEFFAWYGQEARSVNGRRPTPWRRGDAFAPQAGRSRGLAGPIRSVRERLVATVYT